MKKFFAVLLVAGALSACNDRAQTTESATSDSTMAPTDMSMPAPTDTMAVPNDSTATKVDTSVVK